MASPKIWSGSVWLTNWRGRFKIWTGSAWVWARVKVWDGSTWVDQVAPPSGSDSQTVTNGAYTDKYGTSYGFTNGLMGSIADGTSNLYAGASITNLSYYSTTGQITFTVSGSPPNSGWTKMTIAGVDYLRTAASYSGGSWTWSAGSNPFSVNGANVGVTFS